MINLTTTGIVVWSVLMIAMGICIGAIIEHWLSKESEHHDI